LLVLSVARHRIVRSDGVHFKGLRYVSPLLADDVKEPVAIRYDARDISEIRVFYKDQYLCKAVDPYHANATVRLKDVQMARAARRRELRGQINQRIAVVADPQPTSAPNQTTPVASRPKKPKLRTYFEDD